MLQAHTEYENIIQKPIHLHTHIVTMAHTQRHGVDPVDLETEGIIPPYCPHGEQLADWYRFVEEV